MEKYALHIKNGRHRTYSYRKKLKSMGLRYDGHAFGITTDDPALLKKIHRFCFFHGLKCIVMNPEYCRNTTYRNDFFRHYKPAVLGKYFCIYCGRLLSPETVTVDHIIPVKKASENSAYQKFIQIMHWKGVNDHRNLGAACRRCNSRKGAKTGLWLLRGYIGKSSLFQYFRWTVRACLIAALVCFFFRI